MRRSVGIAVVAAGGLLTLGACGDSTTGPGDTTGGELTLSYAEGGQYQADGLPTFNGDEVAPGTFAVAFPDSIGGVVIAAFSTTEGTRGDLFIVQLTDLGTGDFSPCSITNECHGRLLEDIDATNLQDVGAAFEFTDGSVHVDEAGPDRVSGSFSGLVMESPDGETTRTAESGTFDLPLLTEEEGAQAMQCFLASVTGGSCN